MRLNQDTPRLGSDRARLAARMPGWLAALAAITVGGALLVLGLLLSVLVVTLGLTVGLVGYVVLRWKLRGWRRRLDEAARQARAGPGEIIDVQARRTGSRWR